MCWRYFQPRALSKFITNPLPFPLSESGQSEGNSILRIEIHTPETPWWCILKYWDEMREDYVQLTKFLVEERFESLEMKDLTKTTSAPHVFEIPAGISANEWKVCLQFEGTRK